VKENTTDSSPKIEVKNEEEKDNKKY